MAAKIIFTTDLDHFLNAFIIAHSKSERVRKGCCTPTEFLDKVHGLHNEGKRDQCRYYLVSDDSATVAGYAILNGELVAVHSLVKGLGDWLVRNAVADGAIYLDCFEGHLSELYARHGFNIHFRVPNYVQGGPDIVGMYQPA